MESVPSMRPSAFAAFAARVGAARRHACLRAAAAIGLALGMAAGAARAEVANGTLTIGREAREYIIMKPDDAPDGPLPTIIALHGAMQSAGGFRGYFGLDAAAKKHGFVAVYPQGHGRVWNDGRPAAMRLKAMLQPGDDVSFLLALARRLTEEGIADPKRLYLAGISNGGFMTERMACEHTSLFAAYAVIMATTPGNYRGQCRPKEPVPIMFIHGTADTVITYDGFWSPLGETLSAPDSAAFFAEINGCSGQVSQEMPDRSPMDGTTVTLKRFTGCRPGGAVMFYRVNRGGHQSPARVETLPDMATAFLGLRNHDIDAGEEIWRFFSQFPPAPPEVPPALPGQAFAAGAPGPGGQEAAAAPGRGGVSQMPAVPLPKPSPLKDGAQR